MEEEAWLEKARIDFQELLRSLRSSNRPHLRIPRNVLELLTREPQLLESLRQALQALSDQAMLKLTLNLRPEGGLWDPWDPLTDEAMAETATQLALVMSSSQSFKSLRLAHMPAFSMSSILAACPRLEKLVFHDYSLDAATVRSMFLIATLRHLEFKWVDFTNSESISAFCLGIKTCSLVKFVMHQALDPPEQDEQLATALAHCNTLVDLKTPLGASPSFCDHYCVALSENSDTKLERLRMSLHFATLIGFHGDQYLDNTSGPDTAVVAKIRNWPKWNVQRKTCPPLFAAIGSSDTDATRKQCLVEAFEAVDLPIVLSTLWAMRTTCWN